MKKTLVSIMLLCGLCYSYAQQNTAVGSAAASGDVGNCYFLMGEPFGATLAGGRISEGVAQAHLCLPAADTAICQETDFVFYCFHYPDDTAAGTYDETRYLAAVNAGYDSLVSLRLTIHPTYHSYDTLEFFGWIIGGWQLGENIVPNTTRYGCDSNRHVFVVLRDFQCGDPIYDFEENVYLTDSIGEQCWMKENLRSTKKSDGSPIAGSRIYTAPLAPDTVLNLARYGRLYSWRTAMGLNENDTLAPDTNAYGFVHGICPKGWHIPTADEFRQLGRYDASALRSTDQWLAAGTDSTGFSARPGGNYNSQSERYENLLGRTDFWTAEADNAHAYAAQLRFSCEALLLLDADQRNAFSVRCIKE